MKLESCFFFLLKYFQSKPISQAAVYLHHSPKVKKNKGQETLFSSLAVQQMVKPLYCMCVCLCACERERERKRQGEREKEKVRDNRMHRLERAENQSKASLDVIIQVFNYIFGRCMQKHLASSNSTLGLKVAGQSINSCLYFFYLQIYSHIFSINLNIIQVHTFKYKEFFLLKSYTLTFISCLICIAGTSEQC